MFLQGDDSVLQTNATRVRTKDATVNEGGSVQQRVILTRERMLKKNEGVPAGPMRLYAGWAANPVTQNVYLLKW